MTKTNNDNASRKMQFLQPAILFVIFLSFGGKFIYFFFLIIVVPFSQKYRKYVKLFEK